jgi:hypothetical protein
MTMTPHDEDEDNIRRQLLLDSILNALDAIKLVDSVCEGMDPADVKAAIATAMLRYVAAPTVTH